MTKEALSCNDRDALTEVASVLAKRGMLDRFGVYLRHEHFPVSSDEVVHEINDTQGRISLRRVLKQAELPAEAFPSAWALDADGRAHVETWCCD